MSDPETEPGTEPEIEQPPLTPEEFLAWRSPRLGSENPTNLTNPLWVWMARTRLNAYQGNQAWSGPSPFGAGPMWCFDRFGQSATTLADGRTLYIAGEHEDHYDPDFYIYNDVVVAGTDGSLTIYGYPRDAFPPTDFHTATLVGGHVVVIGNLGYATDRVVGKTLVLELDLDTLSVRKVETSGEAPGWINRHSAVLSASETKITVSGGEVCRSADQELWENVDEWELDLPTWTWARKTHKGWPQWSYVRADHKPNALWDMRHALWYRGVGWKDDYAKQVERLIKLLGFEPDLDLVRSIYLLDASVVEVPEREDEHSIVRVIVDGVTVKFDEDSFWVRAVAEGRLADDRLKALQASVLEKLSKLTATEWTFHLPP